jgi:hypothetical protein
MKPIRQGFDQSLIILDELGIDALQRQSAQIGALPHAPT